MWYWTVVRIVITLDVITIGPVTPYKCWHILHKVKMNETKENPFESAKTWVDQNKQPGEEYVILKMFFV